MWSYHKDVYGVLEGCSCCNYYDRMEIYKTLNWENIAYLKKPFWVFDTRLVVDPKEIKNLGINLWQLGYGKNNNLDLNEINKFFFFSLYYLPYSS